MGFRADDGATSAHVLHRGREDGGSSSISVEEDLGGWTIQSTYAMYSIVQGTTRARPDDRFGNIDVLVDAGRRNATRGPGTNSITSTRDRSSGLPTAGSRGARRNPDKARAIAREHLAPYLNQEYNIAKFRRLGYSQEEIADGGSDRIVDDLVFWGDLDTIVEKLHGHVNARADHVAVQVIGIEPGQSAMPRWRGLADAVAPQDVSA